MLHNTFVNAGAARGRNNGGVERLLLVIPLLKRNRKTVTTVTHELRNQLSEIVRGGWANSQAGIRYKLIKLGVVLSRMYECEGGASSGRNLSAEPCTMQKGQTCPKEVCPFCSPRA